MLGSNVASGSSGRSSLRSTRAAFLARASILGNSPARTSGRSRNLDTAFRSPDPGIPSQALPNRGRRSRPITSVSHWPWFEPVNSALTSSPAFAKWGRSPREARFPISHQRSRLLSRLSLPSGVFRPLGIKRAERVRLREAFPDDQPDCPSLPAGCLIESCNLRITVPDSLLFAGFAVP
jgi:hypothetical protein